MQHFSDQIIQPRGVQSRFLIPKPYALVYVPSLVVAAEVLGSSSAFFFYHSGLRWLELIVFVQMTTSSVCATEAPSVSSLCWVPSVSWHQPAKQPLRKNLPWTVAPLPHNNLKRTRESLTFSSPKSDYEAIKGKWVFNGYTGHITYWPTLMSCKRKRLWERIMDKAKLSTLQYTHH